MLVVIVALLACAPRTAYRHSAAVPAARPLAWDGRTVPRDSVRVEGAATFTSISYDPVSQVHETALYVPDKTLDGVLTYAFTNRLELGVRGSYADGAWFHMSAAGTMPLPEGSRVWGVGPELRLMVPLQHDERFALGFAGNYMTYELPTARWSLDPACAPPATCFDGYRRVATDVEGRWVANAAAYFSARLHERPAAGSLFGGVSAHEAFKNDGFTDQVSDSDGGTLEKDGFVAFLSGGYALVFQGARLSAQGFVPLAGSHAVQYGPGLIVTLGGSIRLGEQPEAGAAAPARTPKTE